MQKKVLLVTPGLCGVCKNLSILLAIRQCGVRNKISELFLLCFLLGAALESLYIGLYKSMYSRGNHGGVKMTNQKKPLLNRPSRTPRIIPNRF